MKNCRQCNVQFELSELEKQFLEKVSPVIAGQKYLIPEPTLCSVCRRQRRYSFRNDWNLYKRNCSKTGKGILSVFPADVKFPVYSQESWWSDEFDARDYGRDFDFSRPFFEQFAELQDVLPRVASMVVNSENCDYTAFTFKSRNCYLASRLAENEDIYYSYLVLKCNTCFDSYNLDTCELCYECIDCKGCYNCFYAERCKNSNDLMFCKDMIGCKDCFGCIGLVQKQYYFFNEKLNREEYEKRVSDWMDGSLPAIDRARAKLDEMSDSKPIRAVHVYNSESATGTYIFDSKNAYASFDLVGCEDVIHCTQLEYAKDVMDGDFALKPELSYEMLSGGMVQRMLFSFVGINNCSEITYCMESYNGTQNCFGCIGMKKGQYCILNKQYTKEEYEALVPRIIEHMRSSGEWGEYFPSTISPFPYNRTVAMDYIPLRAEEVRARGLIWEEKRDELASASGEGVLTCAESGRPFRLVPQEIEFYKKMKLPMPTLHPDVRHKNRLARRNPYRLKNANCDKCQKSIMTDEQRDRMIYCESCYLSEIY
ncbi:hypothetical protein HOH67_00100 [Candidatus Peregrinibacteria bacterium]|nr:hypothetical protein [Candidatus Peregrinibacteria bacterium]MBT5823517.1 hypothetical protein [Candidatus Peregrinibacteria bacterium]